MTVESTTALWSSPDWIRSATRWMDEVLTRRGVNRDATSPRQPRVRPWSTELVVETDHGRVWFKACSPSLTPEAKVHPLLADVAPDAVPTVWATEPDEGWLLMPDQSPVLREQLDADSVVTATSTVLRRYARLQRATEKITDALVEVGTPRYEPHDLVRAWEASGLGAGAVTALGDAADRLVALGVSSTVQHDDLHVGNVFSEADPVSLRDSRIFDWGDMYVGHPFLSLLIPLRGPSHLFDLPDDAERDARLGRAYFTGWSDVASTTALNKLLPDVLLLARIGRWLGWQRALEHATTQERAQWSSYPQQWIDEINDLTA